MSDLPGCILEWERRNLRKCIEEGREPPSDERKRLALLKMLPPKNRAAIWDTANKLYPTFADLLAKTQEMIQDAIDAKNGVGPMDLDDMGT